MRLYQLGKLGNLDALKLTDAPEPRPGPGQVVVRIRACSLNHRDLNIVSGGYTSHALKPGAIPLSDGAGEVTAVGAGVTRWKAGDRVAPIFVQRWLGGELTARVHALGAGRAERRRARRANRAERGRTGARFQRISASNRRPLSPAPRSRRGTPRW